MGSVDQVQKEYDDAATLYRDLPALPSGVLESQLIAAALGHDCSGRTVLDLGGGTGSHAREALSLGAAAVDVVDLSPGMLRVAAELSAAEPRRDALRFFAADCARPLDHLPLRAEGYDVVMANWLFSHADTLPMLEGMFRNIVGHLKPGGRLVNVHDGGPRSPMFGSGKYGTTFTKVWDIPGGTGMAVEMASTPPSTFEACSLEIIHSGSTEIYERFGFADFQVMPYEETAVVRADPEFWQLAVENPQITCLTAVKKKET